MAGEKYQFEFSDGGSLDRLAAKLNEFVTKIRQQQAALAEGAGRSEALDDLIRQFQQMGQQFDQSVQASIGRIDTLRQRIETLRQRLAELDRTDPKREFTIQNRERASIGNEIEQARLGILQEEKAIRDHIIAAEERSRNTKVEAARLAREAQEAADAEAAAARERAILTATGTQRQRLEQERLQEQARKAVTGASLQEAVERRRLNLRERERQILEQIVEQQARIEAGTTKNIGSKQFETILRLQDQINRKEVERNSLLEQERKKLEEIEDAALAQSRSGTRLSSEERSSLAERQTRAAQELLAIRQRLSVAEREYATAIRQRGDALAVVTRLEQESGSVGTEAMLERLLEVQRQMSQLDTEGIAALGDIAGVGDLQAAFADIANRAKQIEAADITEEEALVLYRNLNEEARRLLETVENIGSEGIPPPFEGGDMFAGLPTFERTVLGAFQGLGQRFRATLQFALSGSLLFQAQRLAREFIQAAIEVERTFEDIKTAFEFDISGTNPEAIRGTFAFDQQIDKIRRRLVDLADDLQALPTEVNQAAYEMVARFTDVEAALIATRAQVLATKVSTISQAESLNALTAVAESFGQTLDRSLSGQERQIALAKLYAQALDGAVAIQQRFGVSVEETIEGTAGLAELAALQGFSLAQTQAMLAITIQRLGVEGSTAADGLGRALSQLSDPSIQGQVLGLAKAVDELRLTTLDFADGETAIRRIREELTRIEEVDPALADQLRNRLTEIIGGRREARFVAPLLVSSDVIGEAESVVGESAGEAERRFAFLAETTSEMIQSIIGQFQELAQNLETLGFLQPLKVMLGTLDGILNMVNELIKKFSAFFEFFNRFRIGDTGVGEISTMILSAVVAATALTRALQTAHFALTSLAGTKLAGLAGQVTKAGGLPVASSKGIASGAATGVSQTIGTVGLAAYVKSLADADKQLLTFGKTLLAFFINPLGTVRTLLTVFASSLARLWVSLRGSAVATDTAVASELRLTRGRHLAASATNTAFAALARLGAGLATVVGGLLRFATGFLVIYAAIEAFGQLTRILGDIPNLIRDVEDSSESGRSRRAAEIVEEAAESGTSISTRDALIQAIQERLDGYKEDLEAIDGFWQTATEFLLTAVGQEDRSTLTKPGILRRRSIEQFELIQLRLQEFGEEISAVTARARGGDLGPEEAAKLQSLLDRYQALVLAVGEIDPDFTDPTNRAAVEALYSQLLGLNVDIETDLTTISDAIEGFRTGVQAAIKSVQERLQLGDIDSGQAIGELRAAVQEAEQLLVQAQAGSDPREIEEGEAVVREARLALSAAVEQEIALVQQMIQATADTPVEQAAAALQAAIAALEISESNYRQNSTLIRQRRFEVAQAERAYAEAIREEAFARLRLEADSAKTFREQLDALTRLRQAIQAEIIAREGAAAFFSGRANVTVDEAQTIIELEEQMTQIRLRQATLRAKLGILEKRSTLDNIAAIAADIAATRAEIEFLRADGADELLVREKLQELREQQSAFLLAQADRRASFFALTAGTGNELAAAQATLRAATDRLQTITDLGGLETQQGYDAQLEVLRARQALVELSLRQADLERRIASDLSDSLAQAFLDVQAAQQALASATGPLERLDAQQALQQAELSAQREFYDRRLSDLDFLFRTDQIGQSQYISALRTTQSQIDRTTRQGEELWRQIELEIRGLADSAANLAFNIPTEIQLPTLFEVRRALAADALGVNYMDNRQQDINVFVSDNISLSEVVAAIEDRFGGSIDIEASRLATGGAGITIGGFS